VCHFNSLYSPMSICNLRVLRSALLPQWLDQQYYIERLDPARRGRRQSAKSCFKGSYAKASTMAHKIPLCPEPHPVSSRPKWPALRPHPATPRPKWSAPRTHPAWEAGLSPASMAVFSHQTTGNRQNQNYNLKVFQSLYMKVNGQVLPARSGHPSAVIPPSTCS